MIEVPRAAITADEIAAEAEFFSFGTNDLTQMCCGFSRDDAGSFLPAYVEKKIYADDPFISLDTAGVGKLMRIAVQLGRGARPDLKMGICGEHGGDPASIRFCHDLGLDYVSCSPFRVPIARLAAAQAELANPAGRRRAAAKAGAKKTRREGRGKQAAAKKPRGAGALRQGTRRPARPRRRRSAKPRARSAAEAALAVAKVRHGAAQVGGRKRGQRLRRVADLGVGALPEQHIPRFEGAADVEQQVRVRDARGVQPGVEFVVGERPAGVRREEAAAARRISSLPL